MQSSKDIELSPTVSVERYWLNINWDIDIRGKLAGAKSDKKVDNWMKNIH